MADYIVNDLVSSEHDSVCKLVYLVFQGFVHCYYYNISHYIILSNVINYLTFLEVEIKE